MNTYEVLIIFKPILDVENVDAILDQFQKNIVEANKGEILEVDRIGRKRLAYEIGKFKDGFLAMFLLKLPPENVADFKRACQISDDVLRITLVRQDHLSTKEEGRRDRDRDRDREDTGFRRDRERGGGRREFSGARTGGRAPVAEDTEEA